MSKVIIERKQIRCSNAELAAMYLNNEISTQQYFDALETKNSSPKPQENK